MLIKFFLPPYYGGNMARMELSAQSTFGKPLLLSDGSKLGKIENFILNTATKNVDLLVVPEIAPKLIRTHAGNVVGMMASQAVGRIKDIVPIEMIAPISGTLGGPIGGIIATDLKKRLKVAEESYYLIPAIFVTNITSESVQVTLRRDECKEWFSTPVLPPEVHVAFYDSFHYEGQKRSFEIDIGLPSVNDRMARDTEGGKEILVKDMQVNTVSGKGVLVNS
jgi:sporulation protein YlmC with PRC-barrel domain